MVCEYFRQKISAGSDSESASCAEIRQSKRNAAALIIVQTIFVQPYTDERADMNVSPLFDCVKRHVKMIAKTKWSMERSMVEIT